jgi:PAS domain-containing protein
MRRNQLSDWRALPPFGFVAAFMVTMAQAASRGTVISNESNRWAARAAHRLGNLLTLILNLSKMESVWSVYVPSGGSAHPKSCTVLPVPGGNPRAFSETTRHPTETEAPAAKYHNLLEATPAATVIVNESGEVVPLNVWVDKQFGYSRDQLPGQPATYIIPGEFEERRISGGPRSIADAPAQKIGKRIEPHGRCENRGDFWIRAGIQPPSFRRIFGGSKILQNREEYSGTGLTWEIANLLTNAKTVTTFLSRLRDTDPPFTMHQRMAQLHHEHR